MDLESLYAENCLTSAYSERSRAASLAKAKGCTPGQLAPAWVLAQGDDIIPIPGTKRVAYREENMGGANVTLNADELREIDEILPAGAAAGDRYNPQGTLAINR